MFLRIKNTAKVSEETKFIADEFRNCLKERLGLSNRDVSVSCKLVSMVKEKRKLVCKTEGILVIVNSDDNILYTKVKKLFDEFKYKYQSDELVFAIFSKREYTMMDWGF